MKTAICKITFDGWDWRNLITVTSPTGKTINMRADWHKTISEEVRECFTRWNDYWSTAKFGQGKQHFEEELSYEIMRELLRVSNFQKG